MTWCVACDARYFAVRTCGWCGGPAHQWARRWRGKSRGPGVGTRRSSAASRPNGPNAAGSAGRVSTRPRFGRKRASPRSGIFPGETPCFRRSRGCRRRGARPPRPSGRPVDLTRRYARTHAAGGRGATREQQRQAAWLRRQRTDPRARLTGVPLRCRIRCQLCRRTVPKSASVCPTCSSALKVAVRARRLTQQSIDRHLKAGRGDVLRLILRSLPSA